MKEPSAAQLAARFQPGDKGNPKGRKKRGFSLAATLARFGHKKNPETKHRYYDDMVIGIWKRAAQGDMEATKYIMDRVLGRPAQELKLDTQQPALVFQILDPRLPAPSPELPAPEQEQEAVDGEVVHLPSREGWRTAEQPPIEDVATRTLLEDGDLDHPAPDVEPEA